MSSSGRGRARGRARGIKVDAAPPPGQLNEAKQVREEIVPFAPKNINVPAQKAVPAQFADAGLAQSAAASLTITKTERAKRPGYGQNFIRKIPLYANYFNLKLPTGIVYQYDVEITPEQKNPAAGAAASAQPKKKTPTRLPARVTKNVFNQLVKEYKVFAQHYPVYDGNKTLVTRYPLSDMIKKTDFEVKLFEDGRQNTFFVAVKPALTAYGNKGEVDLDSIQRYISRKQSERPLDSIRIMDLIFRHGPMMALAPVGRSFFLKPTRDEDVPPFGGGREIWFGYTQSVRATEWGPLLNVDITATVFYKEGPILEFAGKVLNCELKNSGLDLVAHKKLSKEVGGLRVRTTHSSIPRKYTIAGLSKKGASEIVIKLDNPIAGRKEITVEEYFFRQYNYRLKYPLLPCFQVQPRTKNTYIPMEVCVMLPEQHCKRRLTEQQTANMIRKTCKTPRERFQDIRNRLEETRKHSAPYLDYFGISLGNSLVEVNSRVLKPPGVVYELSDTFVPDKGAWNIADHKFYKASKIDEWVVVNYGNCRENELRKFADMLRTEANRLGMVVQPVRDIKNLQRERKLGAEEVLRRMKAASPSLELVVLVIPGRSDMSNYDEIKKAGDTKLGLVTQCIKDVNVSRKCNPSLLGNLCQKINVKMGGINNSLTPQLHLKTSALFDEPVLVFGADVTHPSPGDNSPSIAAVVGSLDRNPSRFAARVQVQKSTLGGIQSRVELILDLKSMVKELLCQFRKATQQKPEKLYFFRDGVSETQFPEVLHYEVNQIRQACLSLSPEYKPSLTFICVQKRHHTRFCPKNRNDECGRAGNVPPGTTVDTGIVSPIDFDFFLCSHFGLQGTSRPTHYSVLLDENNMSADQVQALCYHLCHTYARCTRSLSIPAPVQYAHLAAFRARSHLAQVIDFSSSSGSSNGGHSENPYENEELIENAIKIVSSQLNSMYFV